jgi:pimeloyl-ACP methyl ester carboxylesterase
MAELVFLPGAGGSASFWKPVADELADLGPTHVFGWPGFGDVPADPTIGSLDDLFHWLLRRLPKGPSHVIAQSMGGILAVRLALDDPDRLASLVLVATSGGVDLQRLGAADWRPEYLRELAGMPRWFVEDRTDFTDRLGEIRAPTLLVSSDSDPVSPLAVSRYFAKRIPHAQEITVRGGSHAFASERPEEVAVSIRAFILSCRDPPLVAPAQGS